MEVKTFVVSEMRSNCYFLTDEESGECAVIDCGAFEDYLHDTLNSSDIKKVKCILLTHGHLDHILGVPELKRQTGAPVCIHTNDEVCLYDEKRSFMSAHRPGEQELMKADILLGDGDILYLGKNKIECLHTPGHSSGSVCFLCGNLLFTGDTLFCRTIGRTDFEDSCDDDMNISLKRLYELPGDYKVYPGHNRSSTLQFERETNRYLVRRYRSLDFIR